MKLAGFIFANILILQSILFAGGKHEHGTAYLSLEPSGKTLKVRLDSAADNIIGFEHAAKTEAQKNEEAKAASDLKNSIGQWFKLPEDLKCKWTNDQFEDGSAHKGHGHRDYQVEWTAQCEKSIEKQKMSINIGERFKRIHELKVTILLEGTQIPKLLEDGRGEIQL